MKSILLPALDFAADSSRCS